MTGFVSRFTDENADIVTAVYASNQAEEYGRCVTENENRVDLAGFRFLHSARSSRIFIA